MKQIEVNGMVLEFEEKLLLKQEIKVGDTVQLLVDEQYSTPSLYTGVVTQILPFDAELPCVEVVYIEDRYSSFDIKRKLITNKSDEKCKIIKQDNIFLPYTKDRAIDILDADIRKCEEQLRVAKEKKEYFLRYYGKYFSEVNTTNEEA